MKGKQDRGECDLVNAETKGGGKLYQLSVTKKIQKKEHGCRLYALLNALDSAGVWKSHTMEEGRSQHLMKEI